MEFFRILILMCSLSSPDFDVCIQVIDRGGITVDGTEHLYGSIMECKYRIIDIRRRFLRMEMEYGPFKLRGFRCLSMIPGTDT